MRIVRGRIEDTEPAPGALRAEFSELKADIAIIRLPAGDLGPLRELMDHGLTPIHADTLVYCARALDCTIKDKSINCALTVELARPEDLDSIAMVAERAFSTYRSHYHANRLLDPGLITKGYAEWATSFLTQPTPEHDTWVVRHEENIIAFATCRLSPSSGSVEIVLNAVDPASAGQGVYSHLLNQVLYSYWRRDFKRVCISTQIWNYIVQKAWARAGFVITHAYDTYHINFSPGSREDLTHPV